jgi:hypothetical protein
MTKASVPAERLEALANRWDERVRASFPTRDSISGEAMELRSLLAEAREEGKPPTSWDDDPVMGPAIREAYRDPPALDRTPPQTERSNEMSDESGWLIELPMTKGVICWWAGNGGGDYPYGIVWTEDSMKAVRFSRREDAEKVIVGLGQWHLDQEPIATSHEWVGSTPPQKPDAAIASAPSQGVNERDWSKIRDYMDCLGDTEEEKKLRIRWVREMKAENKELRARLAALHSPEPPKAGKP